MTQADTLKGLREIPGCAHTSGDYHHIKGAINYADRCDACLALVRDAVLEEAATKITVETEPRVSPIEAAAGVLIERYPMTHDPRIVARDILRLGVSALTMEVFTDMYFNAESAQDMQERLLRALTEAPHEG